MYPPPMVGRPGPVEIRAEGFAIVINVIYPWIFPVVLAGLNQEDSHGRILGKTSSNGCASETSADDDVIKGLVGDRSCGCGDAG